MQKNKLVYFCGPQQIHEFSSRVYVCVKCGPRIQGLGMEALF